jgi:hypothetical protein
MATADPFQRQPESFEQAIFFESFEGIMRTGRSIPALGPDQWRDPPLVDPDQGDERKAKYFEDWLH